MTKPESTDVQTPLGHVCEVMSGNAWPAKQFNFSGKGLPVIRIQNMEGDNAGKVAFWDGPYNKKYVVATNLMPH